MIDLKKVRVASEGVLDISGLEHNVNTYVLTKTRNIITFDKFVAHSQINGNTGVYKEASTYENSAASPVYVPVEENTPYVFSSTAKPTGTYFYFYRKTGSGEVGDFISRIKAPCVSPDGAGFMRIQLSKNGCSEEMAKAEKIQLEVGSVASDYVPMLGINERYIDPSVIKRTAISDAKLKSDYTNKEFIQNVISGASRTAESAVSELEAGTNAVLGRHDARIGNKIRFALITDTHIGGTRSGSFDPTYNISSFVSMARKYADFAVHCGDLITNYKCSAMSSKEDVKTALITAAAMYSGLTNDTSIPFLLSKGNHDAGLSQTFTASSSATYEDNMYYYKDSEDTYVLITSESEFNERKAAGLYTIGVDLITNEEYYSCCQSGYLNGSTYVNANDGYYYRDFGNKLRVIVMNDFYVNDDGTTGINETQINTIKGWLTSARTSGLQVLTISHWEKGFKANVSIFQEFVEKGGIYIGHIHGHEHCDLYTITGGLNNIAVNWGAIKTGTRPSDEYDDRLNHNALCYSFFEIDFDKKRLYEVRTGCWDDRGEAGKRVPQYRSEDRVFDYEEHREIV